MGQNVEKLLCFLLFQGLTGEEGRKGRQGPFGQKGTNGIPGDYGERGRNGTKVRYFQGF